MEKLLQTFLEFIKQLNVVIRPVHTPISVIKINVGCDERAVFLENLCNLGEFLGLKLPDIFKYSLRDNNVELFLAESNGSLEEIRLNKVWGRIVYCDINAMIVNIIPEQLSQRRRAAADIQQIAFSSPGDRIYDTRCFLHSKMGLRIFQVLGTPKIPFVVCIARLWHRLSFPH